MRLHHLYFLIFLLLPFCSSGGNNPMEIIRSMPMRANLMTVDELGNVYVVKNNNTLLRFTQKGDSSGFYRSIQNGDIGFIDATNPLKIVVYYPAYSKIVLLDGMLAVKNELDLRKLNIPMAAAIASSADGNLWVFDQFNAKLVKIDEDLKIVAQSNDLRQETESVPNPSFMVEKDWKIFVCDPAKGILTFDRYASYLNTISVYGVKYLQVNGSQLIYRNDDTLHSWDMNEINANTLVIPGTKIISAAVSGNVLYVLYNEGLVLFRMKEKE